MKNRTIKQSIASNKVNMGGIVLEQPLPTRDIDQLDPFLLIHHWDQKHYGGKQQKDLGVGPHPHRGFSPVTLIYQGGVHHRDSLGNDSIIMAGGTQWMHSGSGIVHSERPVKEIAEDGGNFEIIQFWVNTPASKKMVPPKYIPLSKEDTPRFIDEETWSEVDIISGELFGKKGYVDTYSPMLILNMRLKKGAHLIIPVDESFNALTYILDGKLTISGNNTFSDKTMTIFSNDGDSIMITADEDSRVILLSGKPLNEPVTSYGPMVMNTQKEIIDALNDYENGTMGILNENFK